MDRRDFLKTAAMTAILPSSTAVLAATPPVRSARPGSELKIAMTLSDIPLTTGQSTQGAEGQRFMAMSVYDALFRWDLSQTDKPAELVPALAETYSVDKETRTIWTFNLRKGVKFHDGSEFNADAVLWNFDKLIKKDSPQFDQSQANQAASRLVGVVSYKKLDDYTVEVRTAAPDAMFFYRVSAVYYSSPTHWRALGGSWAAFAKTPSGTGPFKLESFVPRSRANLVRNAQYWDAARVPRVEKLTLFAMPDPSTRVAALLSGQVNWVEALPPDAIPRLRRSNINIFSKVYPHVWPYWLSYAEGSPFLDIRVRKAANLAIDRDGMSKLLGGFAKPAKGMVDTSSPWFGKPTFDIVFDPAAARKLLTEAGYGPGKPCKITLLTSQAGSGQMQPLAMNEFVQANLNKVGFEVTIEVVDWEALRARRSEGAGARSNRSVFGLNNSWSIQDPDFGMLSVTWSKRIVPKGNNWGLYQDETADKLCDAAVNAFTREDRDRTLSDLHAYIVSQAMWIWVVHDTNPRALAANVKNFDPPQNWYVDLTQIEVG